MPTDPKLTFDSAGGRAFLHDYGDYNSFGDWWDSMDSSQQVQAGMLGAASKAKKSFNIQGDSGYRPKDYTPVQTQEQQAQVKQEAAKQDNAFKQQAENMATAAATKPFSANRPMATPPKPNAAAKEKIAPYIEAGQKRKLAKEEEMRAAKEAQMKAAIPTAPITTMPVPNQPPPQSIPDQGQPTKYPTQIGPDGKRYFFYNGQWREDVMYAPAGSPGGAPADQPQAKPAPPPPPPQGMTIQPYPYPSQPSPGGYLSGPLPVSQEKLYELGQRYLAEQQQIQNQIQQTNTIYPAYRNYQTYRDWLSAMTPQQRLHAFYTGAAKQARQHFGG